MLRRWDGLCTCMKDLVCECYIQPFVADIQCPHHVSYEWWSVHRHLYLGQAWASPTCMVLGAMTNCTFERQFWPPRCQLSPPPRVLQAWHYHLLYLVVAWKEPVPQQCIGTSMLDNLLVYLQCVTFQQEVSEVSPPDGAVMMKPIQPAMDSRQPPEVDVMRGLVDGMLSQLWSKFVNHDIRMYVYRTRQLVQ